MPSVFPKVAWMLWSTSVVCAVSVSAQAASDIQVEVAGVGHVLTVSDLRSLPQDTVRGRVHDGPEQVFVGPQLTAVLKRAGASLDSLRGARLAQYVVVEARDNYRVVFSIAELDKGFISRQVILAHSVDGHALPTEQGPWRLVVEGELRPARWVRQVSALRVRSAP